MFNYDGLTETGAKYRLMVDLHPMDLHYRTRLSPKHRRVKLRAINSIQKHLDAATELAVNAGLPVCVCHLGAWGLHET